MELYEHQSAASICDVGSLRPFHSGPKDRSSASARFTLVFVCDDPVACSTFYGHLRDAGFRVLVAHNLAVAVLCACTEPVDCVLIYRDDVRLGSITGCEIRLLFPNAPVVLVCAGTKTMAPPAGIDAVCYGSSLDDEMARTVACVFCDLLIKRRYPAYDSGACTGNALGAFWYGIPERLVGIWWLWELTKRRER